MGPIIKNLVLATFILVAMNTQTMAKEYFLAISDYPPYEYSENNEAKGLFVDILREVFVRMGDELRVEILPWTRVLRMGEEGKLDMFVAFKTREREAYLDFSRESILIQTISFFARKDANIDYTGDLSDFQDLRIGVVQDISYGNKFDKAVSAGVFRKVEVHKEGDYIPRKLLNGRLDLMISHRYGAWFLFKKLGTENQIKELTPPVQVNYTYLAFSKKKDLGGLREKFNRVLAEMKADGSYEIIIENFLQININ